jgi:hypothetical protein
LPTALTLGGHAAGKPFAFTIHKGQSYLVTSIGDSADLSGTVITAAKPVAVISGYESEHGNFIVQQLIPESFQDTTGYISLPLDDSIPADYRIYSNSKLTSNIKLLGSCTDTNSLAIDNTKKFVEVDSINCSLDIESENSLKSNPVIYQHAVNEALYRTMMNIIPMSRWRKSFVFFVPADSLAESQNDYINLIANRLDFDSSKIVASVNGGPVKLISSLMTLEKRFNDIPNHPELIGARYKLSPGSYYLSSKSLFMAYSFGTHRIISDSTRYTYSYGSPIGFGMTTIYTKISVHVDTLSSSWLICAHDSTFGLEGYGITDAYLLDGDDCYQRPCPQFFNCHIDLDTAYNYEIKFSPPDTDVCFKVSVYNPHDSAYAPIYIYDSMGSHSGLLELRYYPPKINDVSQKEHGEFSIYPNPVSANTVFISVPETSQEIRFSVFDILGKEVLHTKSFQSDFSVDHPRSLPNGLYVVQIRYGDLMKSEQLHIVR